MSDFWWARLWSSSYPGHFLLQERVLPPGPTSGLSSVVMFWTPTVTWNETPLGVYLVAIVPQGVLWGLVFRLHNQATFTDQGRFTGNNFYYSEKKGENKESERVLIPRWMTIPLKNGRRILEWLAYA